MMDEHHPAPLYILCVDSGHHGSEAVGVACRRAVQMGGRVGLFNTLQLDEFQGWATVEDTLKQELREQSEKELWVVAGHIRDNYDLTPEFYIEEGRPLDALKKIIKAYPEIAEVIVTTEKKDAADYLELKAVKKFPVPLVLVSDHPKSEE
ncbi:MAG TPA: hypothetical protein PKI93_03225 [Alphaproteobacteria bacterium]|nr:hypothetical protein [Alphaproteobacteria bacterium]HNS45497.1 hypothetical protein [Alphaproteobacteria bacterium]